MAVVARTDNVIEQSFAISKQSLRRRNREWARAALLDRLLHRCHIINIRGNSYRMRDHGELSRSIHPTTASAVRAEQAQIQEQS